MATREKPLHLVLFQGESSPADGFVRENPKSNPRASQVGEPGREAQDGTAALGSEELLQVGELAKATGKTVRAIHLYEELGLLRAHERSKGRYRLFTNEALVRVRWITKLQSLGLSLSEIQELVKEQEDLGSAQFASARLGEVYRGKLLETRTKIAELRALEAELEDSLSFLATCGTACEPELPVHSCPTCERHPERPNAPDLVAGVRLKRTQVS
ncbi:MAG TPA: MerR family transcriptional regulator [Polyangiaceae bacterium]